MLQRISISGIFLLCCIPFAYGDDVTQGLFRFVTVSDGSELATHATGQAVRGTILLAMGATASMVWWPESMVTELAGNGYQVIQFDHRDTGQSTTNPPGKIRYGIFDMSSDLIDILDAYDVDQANLVGMSLGGYVSQITALNHPQRVRSLTLIASEPIGVPYDGEGIGSDFMQHFASMADLDWSNHEAVVQFMLKIAELSAGSAAPFDRDAVIRRIENEWQRTSSIQSAFNHSMISGELGTQLNASKLDLPVLLVHGSEDPIISVAAAHASASIVTGAQLLILDGRGHELLEADVPTITKAILTLIGRQE